MPTPRFRFAVRLVSYHSLAFLCLLGLVALSFLLTGSSTSGHAQYPATVPQGGQPTETPPPNCGTYWRTVPSPDGSNEPNTLTDLSSLSPNDVWAVGYTGNMFADTAQPLMLHWNGSTWSTVPTPAITGNVVLNAVESLAPNNVWAVGFATFETLILHWDGASWTRIPSYSAPAVDNILTAITAISHTDMWAVGYAGESTLTLHWNGTAWSYVPSPNVPLIGGNELFGVWGASSNDVWAVGGLGFSTNHPLTLHWDGTTWYLVDNPAIPNGDFGPNTLYAVSGTSSNDVWAVGAYRDCCSNRTLTEHWNGSTWTIVPSPGGPPGEAEGLNRGGALNSVEAIAPNDVWAVGGGAVTRVLHWNGTAWAIVTSPSPDPDENRLNGIDALSSGDLWAVGSQGPFFDSSTLTMRYSDPCLTPSPTPTGTPPTPSPTSTPACPIGWSVSPSGNIGSDGNYLNAVATASSTDAWAVGYFVNSDGVEQTLTERWNGTQWQVVPSPSVGAIGHNRLTGVAVVSPNDVWAVGYYFLGSLSQTLALHWNGTDWSVVTTPNPGSNGNYLHDVTAISSSDVWAVGSRDSQTLTLHWNGTAWATVASYEDGSSELLGVDAVASNDVWAVGTVTFGPTPDTLILHWNGTAWTEVLSPSPGEQYPDILESVVAITADDVWAVGYYRQLVIAGDLISTMVLHWDGTDWTHISTPNVASLNNYLYDVTVAASNDLWAVGAYVGGSPSITRTLALRWDGASWGVANTVDAGSTANALYSVALIAQNDLLAVGYSESGSPARTLAERYLRVCSGPTPTPPVSTPTRTLTPTITGIPTGAATSTRTPTGAATPTRTSTPTFVPTQTPGGPTATPPPSSTPTAPSSPTATSCPIQFTDVPEGSTFYEFIRCMACRGIINGYASGCETGDPCFRPNNNVTRGQLAKIVANAAGFPEPAGAEQFEDVPVGSTFFDFVWRLADREIVSGYPCGGLIEPCVPPGDLPYFRPNANITRGQISKIVSEAAAFDDTPGAQQFEDVVPGSTFYDWIWRLADREIMSGYTCGGPGEPCNPPGNLPYFRPGNNATRGQASKIVANTFYPNCLTPFSAKISPVTPRPIQSA